MVSSLSWGRRRSGSPTRPPITLLPPRGDPVEMDLIARERVIPPTTCGINRPVLAQHLDSGIARARQPEGGRRLAPTHGDGEQVRLAGMPFDHEVDRDPILGRGHARPALHVRAI